MKLITSAHHSALKVMQDMSNNPAKNLTELSKINGMPASQLCSYVEMLALFGWVEKQPHGAQNFHIVTEKGEVALICLYFLVNGNLPEGVEILDAKTEVVEE